MSFNYSQIQVIESSIKPDRQVAKRHYGVHPYFTRRAPNVVRRYIEHYSRLGDRVLDPFGGSGVTAIEAFLSNRHGIHNDINPLGNFIAQQIAAITYETTDYIKRAFNHLDRCCGDLVRRIPRMSDKEVARRLQEVELPGNIVLPKNADVERFHDLFTPRQLLALGILKNAIDDLDDSATQGQLLLAWSATLAKLNRTFISARGRTESRGGSSIFSIYRYKVAKSVVELPPWNTFAERVRNVITAKEEVLKAVKYLKAKGGFCGKFEVLACDALDLPNKLEAVDYIFTDPPYGGNIAYLDLSTIWNHWLEFSVPPQMREREIIVGGELNKSEEDYLNRLRESVRACIKLLKKNRWISIVFQHWNVAYFEAIMEAAEESGSTLRSTVTQAGGTIWSMHKKKNLERVLAGEMILTFFKEERPRRPRPKNHIEIEELVDRVLPMIADSSKGYIHGEVLFNRLIAEAWTQNALKALRISRDEFIALLAKRGWRYDPQSHRWAQRSVESAVESRLW